MAHFLFRPHIDFGDKIVTTDVIFRELVLVLPEEQPISLPADLANCSAELEMIGDDPLVAPAVLLFAGDEALYAAPSIALIDGNIFAENPRWAWRNARISIARRAIKAGCPSTIAMTFQDEASSPIAVSGDCPAGRRRAAIYGSGEIRKANVPLSASVTIGDAICVEHHLSLVGPKRETS